MSEQSQEPLLVHPISPDADFYSRQEDETIITWMDREFGTDIALSFQEGMGCNFIWEQIKSVQRQYASEDGVGAHPRTVPSWQPWRWEQNSKRFSFHRNTGTLSRWERVDLMLRSDAKEPLSFLHRSLQI